MVYAPVGVKCPDCARQRGRAVAGPKPIYYLRAAGAGLASGTIGGVILADVGGMVRFGGLLLVMFLGWAIGEAVSWGARRNRGRAFQWIAGSSAAWAFFIAGYLTGVPVVSLAGWQGIYFGGINVIRLLFAGAGIYMATTRLKD